MGASVLADLLETDREELLVRWRRAVRELPDAVELDTGELEARVVTGLNDLCQRLRAAGTSSDAGTRGGRQRPSSGVVSLVRAIDAVRTTIHALVEDGRHAVTADEVRALSDFTSAAITDAVAEHARRQIVTLPSIAEAVFAQSDMLIAIVEGPPHTFTFANPAYRRAVGKPDLVGRALLEAFPEAREQGWAEMLDAVKSTGRPSRSDELLFRRDRPDGGSPEDAYFNLVYSPKPNAAGDVDGVLISGIDVTESVLARRRVEILAATLREHEERMRRVVEAARMGTWELEVDPTSVNGDAGYRTLLGLPPDGPLTVDECVAALHPGDREATRRAMTLAFSGQDGGLYAVEHRTAARAGQPSHWLEVRGQARFDADGKAVGMAGTIIDITARKQIDAERQELLESARRSEAAFRTLAELIPQQVWTSDPTGALDFVNGRVIDYFKESEEQMLGSGWQSTIHPDDLQSCLELWSHSLRTGDEYDVEFRLRRADGQYRWHLGRAMPLHDATGRIVKWFGTSTDFDEEKKTRDELQRRTEFEQHLLGIVSHDLRNPLSVISLSASALARREDLDERAAKSILRIQTAADRGTRMIRDLLDFTQTRLRGAIAIVQRPVNLREIVRAVVDEAEAGHPERQVRATFEGDGRGSWDSDRVAQVLQNLVSNALKYSPARSPVLVATRDEGNGVALSVHNEGPPISAESLTRIFEPLQRATAEIDRTGRSIGLGLYIVKQIVSAHGGSVDVISDEDGTTFTVRLPRAGAT